jgi:hypothetical protein
MAGSFVDLVVPDRHSRRLMLAGLHRMSLAALLMLVAQYGLGIVLNLYVAIPAADEHAGIMRVIVNGPLILTLHVLLGLGLVGTAIVLLVRAVTLRDRRFAALAAGGLTAIGGAFAAGEIFVHNGQQFASAAMAILTGVALLCYIGTLTLASVTYRQVAPHRRHSPDLAEPDADDPDPWPPDYETDDTDQESTWPPDYDDESDLTWQHGRADSHPAWHPGRAADSAPPRLKGRNADSVPSWLLDNHDGSAPHWLQGRDADPGPPPLQGRAESAPPWLPGHDDDPGTAWGPDHHADDPDFGLVWEPDDHADNPDLGLVWTPDPDVSTARAPWPHSGPSWPAPPEAR